MGGGRGREESRSHKQTNSHVLTRSTKAMYTKRPAAKAKIHPFTASLSVPMATPMKNPITADRAEMKLNMSAVYHVNPVDSRIT